MKISIQILVIFVNIHFAQSLFGAQKPEGMVHIKSGCFMMGTNKNYFYEDDDDNNREKPEHKVCLDDFYIDRFEVTQKKWNGVMDFNNSVFKKAKQPVTHLDWHQARMYCHKIGARLPTEAEWEYAARAGSTTRFPWGNDIDDDYLWYSGNSLREFANVGTKKPNAWGLYDMVGGVWEWVEDWFSLNYYKNSPVKNPKGPGRQSFRIIRGNSWMSESQHIRVTSRHRGMSDPTQDYWVGVRCAMSLKK